MSTPTTPVVDQTVDEFFGTLTGGDEAWIRRLWNGLEVSTAGRSQPTTWMRALVSIHYRRAGSSDPKHDAMNLTLSQLQEGFFRDDTDAEHSHLRDALAALTAVRDASTLEEAAAAATAVLDKISPDETGGDDPGEAD